MIDDLANEPPGSAVTARQTVAWERGVRVVVGWTTGEVVGSGGVCSDQRSPHQPECGGTAARTHHNSANTPANAVGELRQMVVLY